MKLGSAGECISDLPLSPIVITGQPEFGGEMLTGSVTCDRLPKKDSDLTILQICCSLFLLRSDDGGKAASTNVGGS